MEVFFLFILFLRSEGPAKRGITILEVEADDDAGDHDQILAAG